MNHNNESQNQDSADSGMSLIGHLTELRIRLTRSAQFIVLGTIACWYFSEKVFDFVREPIRQYLPTGGLVFTSPMDKFMAHIKRAVVMGLVLSAPLWLYQVWSFISPGLYRKEKKYAIGFIFF